jgi:hypothetical protein
LHVDQPTHVVIDTDAANFTVFGVRQLIVRAIVGSAPAQVVNFAQTPLDTWT